MTKRIYSLDPEQNAELAAQHAAEARVTGVSVETYWGEDDHQEDREWGDVGWDEDEPMIEYRVDVEPAGVPGAIISVLVDACDRYEAEDKALELYEGGRVIEVVAIG